jgi:large subunit ribosomal protein L24
MTRRIKKPVPPPIAVWKILRGDKVQITSGKERGKRGTVLKVYRKEQRVLVEGLNLVKRHTPGQSKDQPGGIVTKEAPVHLSAVSLLDPVQQVPTKVRWGFLEDGTKVRVANKSGALIPKPDILKQRRHPRPYAGPRDTAPEVAHKKTVSEQDETLHRALRSLTILGDAGHVLEKK